MDSSIIFLALVNSLTEVSKYEFDEDACLITNKKTGDLALSGVRKGSLFVADMDSTSKEKVCCFYIKASNKDSWIWHKRLSHLNFKAINSLVKRELVRVLEIWGV